MRWRYLPFYLIPLALSLVLLGPDFMRRTMYNDGVWYAAIARNLARGEGSFWYPHLSATFFPSFHEHPPLMFGIQSLFFEVFGAGVFTEKFYTLLTFVLSWWLIVRLWRFASHEAGPRVEQAETIYLWFLPVTLWILNEVTYIFYPNNLLEGTLAVFDLAAVLCLLRAARPHLRRNDMNFVVLAGLFTLAALLTKGPVGLFPLAFFFLYWLVFRDIAFRDMVLRSLVLAGTLGIGLGLLLLLPDARDSLWQYFDTQFLASVTAERTTFHHRTSRLYIIQRLFILLLPALLLTGLFWSWLRWGRKQGPSTGFVRWAVFSLAIGLSASVPIAISPKQGFYYLLPSIPYFAIGLGLLVAEGMADWLKEVTPAGKAFRVFRYLSMLLVILSAAFALRHWGDLSRRDRPVWNDVQAISQVVPQGTTISAPSPEEYRAALVGYLQRYYDISVDTTRLDRSFLLLEQFRDTIPVEGYRRLPLEMGYFRLYEREGGE